MARQSESVSLETIAGLTSFGISRNDTEEMMLQQSLVAILEVFDTHAADAGQLACAEFSLCPPHQVESEVSRTLRGSPGVHIESLSVHRIDDGVCLHGVVEVDDPSTDVEDIIRRALSIDRVINRMVVKYGHTSLGAETDLDQSFMWG